MSVYDQFSNHKSPVIEQFKTPNENRKDLSKPYSSEFARSVESAKNAVTESRSNANAEWMKLLYK